MRGRERVIDTIKVGASACVREKVRECMIKDILGRESV
jgi:hypothetical protein